MVAHKNDSSCERFEKVNTVFEAQFDQKIYFVYQFSTLNVENKCRCAKRTYILNPINIMYI